MSVHSDHMGKMCGAGALCARPRFLPPRVPPAVRAEDCAIPLGGLRLGSQ